MAIFLFEIFYGRSEFNCSCISIVYTSFAWSRATFSNIDGFYIQLIIIVLPRHCLRPLSTDTNSSKKTRIHFSRQNWLRLSGIQTCVQIKPKFDAVIIKQHLWDFVTAFKLLRTFWWWSLWVEILIVSFYLLTHSMIDQIWC